MIDLSKYMQSSVTEKELSDKIKEDMKRGVLSSESKEMLAKIVINYSNKKSFRGYDADTKSDMVLRALENLYKGWLSWNEYVYVIVVNKNISNDKLKRFFKNNIDPNVGAGTIIKLYDVSVVKQIEEIIREVPGCSDEITITKEKTSMISYITSIIHRSFLMELRRKKNSFMYKKGSILNGDGGMSIISASSEGYMNTEDIKLIEKEMYTESEDDNSHHEKRDILDKIKDTRKKMSSSLHWDRKEISDAILWLLNISEDPMHDINELVSTPTIANQIFQDKTVMYALKVFIRKEFKNVRQSQKAKDAYATTNINVFNMLYQFFTRGDDKVVQKGQISKDTYCRYNSIMLNDTIMLLAKLCIAFVKSTGSVNKNALMVTINEAILSKDHMKLIDVLDGNVTHTQKPSNGEDFLQVKIKKSCKSVTAMH